MIVYFGPTAVGKSNYVYDLLNRKTFDIVNMDSMQIYKDLNIGTAKPSREEFSKTTHHLFDIVDPDKNFSVYDYQKLALDLIRSKKEIVFVGGTGLYLNSLYYDYKFREFKNFDFNNKSNEELFLELENSYPDLVDKVDKNHRHQLINALKTGNVYSSNNKIKRDIDIKINYLSRDRKDIYDRINKRVDKMIEDGLVDEVKYVVKKYNLNREHQSMKAIGYREILSYLNSEFSLEEAVELIKKNTRHYAKRQITWIRNQYNNDYNTINLEE